MTKTSLIFITILLSMLLLSFGCAVFQPTPNGQTSASSGKEGGGRIAPNVAPIF